MADRHPRVVLASASPRRAELLGRLGITPEIRPADVDETVRPGEDPAGYVARLAAAKATAIAGDVGPDALVVAADTTVVLDGEILGKPVDDADARRLLRRLAGTRHDVLTGLHLVVAGRAGGAVESTAVWFRPLADREIDAYVATGAPLDKAGGYGIQDAGGAFVERVEGSDTNVIGLPLSRLVVLAADLGVELLARTGRAST